MTNTQASVCLHCDAPTTQQESFCCAGCETVYILLNKHQLGHYYELKKQSPSLKQQEPARQSGQQFDYLDSDDICSQQSSDKGQALTLYVEGIHCHACVWLIEKIPNIVSGIHSVRVNMSKNTIHIVKKPEGRFSQVARYLDQCSYRVHLLDQDSTKALHEKQRRQHLMRIGIAAACMANIMIFSLAIYFGLEGPLKTIFDYLSALLMLPVLFFSATPFFKSAVASIRSATMSIDIPVSLALVIGSFISYINIFSGSGYTYFDSLSMFVFLLLSVRFIFNSSYENLDFHSALNSALLPVECLLISKETEQTVSTASLKAGDKVLVKQGDLIPADGRLQQTAYIDLQLLTGESEPKKMKRGDDVLAGMRNVSDSCVVLVEKSGKDTRLATLIHKINHLEKAPLVELADKIAHYFLITTIVICVGLFCYHSIIQGNFSRGFQSVLALLVLACPCALSLATPLAYSMSIHNALKKGICIQSPQVLETLKDINEVVFDKTGTLTKGQLELIRLDVLDDNEDVLSLLYSLEQDSKHPIATSIRHFALKKNPTIQAIVFDSIEEKVSKGMFATLNGQQYKLIASPTVQDGIVSTLDLYKNDKIIAHLALADSLAYSALELIQALQAKQMHCSIISGDKLSCVQAVQKQLGIKEAHAGFSPQDKVAYIKNRPKALMIGDGANDSEALLEATVSVAVKGSFESSLKAADVTFLKNELNLLSSLFDSAERTRRVVYRNFAFSLSYNSIGIMLVLFSYIHPLIAAILMPLSALTVILHSYIALNYVRQ